MNDPKITNVRVLDLRFPTSRFQIGSDAVNKDPKAAALLEHFAQRLSRTLEIISGQHQQLDFAHLPQQLETLF